MSSAGGLFWICQHGSRAQMRAHKAVQIALRWLQKLVLFTSFQTEKRKTKWKSDWSGWASRTRPNERNENASAHKFFNNQKRKAAKIAGHAWNAKSQWQVEILSRTLCGLRRLSRRFNGIRAINYNIKNINSLLLIISYQEKHKPTPPTPQQHSHEVSICMWSIFYISAFRFFIARIMVGSKVGLVCFWAFGFLGPS